MSEGKISANTPKRSTSSFLLKYLKETWGLIASKQGKLIHNLRVCIRYYSNWKTALKGACDSVADELPCLCFECADFLRERIHRGARVFEYGSGGSSLFFSRLVDQVISIEHDRFWHEKVVKALQRRDINNCDCRYLPALEEAVVGEKGACSSIGFFQQQLPGHSFKGYVLAITDYPEDFFDLVVVDGRARNACVA